MTTLIKRITQNTFIKVSSANGLITIAKSFIIIFSNKIVAEIIGLSGIAMLGQLQNFIAISSLISSGGFNQGLTKYVAENRDNKKDLSEFIGTAFVVSTLLTSIAALVIFIFSKSISQLIFKNDLYFSILIFFALTMPFYNLNSLTIAIVNGFQLYRLYFRINITTTFVGVCLTIGLVIFFKEYGALLALVLTQSIVFLITYLLIRKLSWLEAFNSDLFRKNKMLLLLKYTTITVFASIIWPIVGIVIRTYVINNISTEEAGIWQAAQNINGYIITIVMGSFSVYLLPKLSSITDKIVLKRELINIYKVIIPVSLTGFIFIYYLRDFIIILLYTKGFLKIGDYLLFQMIGTFFWICKVPIMNLILAKGLTRIYLINELSFAFLYMALCIFFIPLFKVQGIQLSFAIYNFMYLIVNIFLIKKYLNR